MDGDNDIFGENSTEPMQPTYSRMSRKGSKCEQIKSPFPNSQFTGHFLDQSNHVININTLKSMTLIATGLMWKTNLL